MAKLKCIFLLFYALAWQLSVAQQSACSLSLQGKVLDMAGKYIDDAEIIITATQQQTLCDSIGRFRFSNLCAGNITIAVNRLSCKSEQFKIRLSHDTVVVLNLDCHAVELNEVNITSEKRTAIATLAIDEVTGIDLLQTRGESLGESLKEITGINSIQTGPSISKPVIHGLHSNRVLILNNEVRQEGQQWGSEHAPEIDPFIASKVSIIKGAASIRYGSDAIGGVVLLQPQEMPDKPGVGADVTLVGGSNGAMGGISGLLEGAFGKKLAGLAIRVQGTIKRAGNFRTAHYYMKNTGFFEGDFSGALQYHRLNFGAEFFYSEYNNKIGIFEGSHVGNIADLYAAFNRSVPITPSYFTYSIGRTYQTVQHDLLKASVHYHFKNAGKLEAIYARQADQRKEYDIDLPYSTDPDILKMPELAFKITTNSLDLIFTHNSFKGISGSAGITGLTQGNVYKGLRYLIPNFRVYTGGVFWIEKFTKNKFTVEAGVRYDYRWQRVYILDNNSLQTLTPTHTYQNVSFTVGGAYAPNNHLSINLNVGSAFRAPSINELYIQGIHLSAASYELGDTSLQSERAYNTTLSARYKNKWLTGEMGFYYNYIHNYIYAKPALQTVTLISGTYPLFKYVQTNADFTGFDLDLTFNIWRGLSVQTKLSVLRAYNHSAHEYLVYAPANRWENIAKYQFAQIGKLSALYFSFSDVWVMRQKNVPPNSDYVEPPKAYVLLNAGLGFSMPVKKQKMDVDLSIYNLTNTAYRDYLNRFRYYTDDLGINVVLRVHFTLNYFKN